jgi:hypothetical protein
VRFRCGVESVGDPGKEGKDAGGKEAAGHENDDAGNSRPAFPGECIWDMKHVLWKHAKEQDGVKTQ